MVDSVAPVAGALSAGVAPRVGHERQERRLGIDLRFVDEDGNDVIRLVASDEAQVGTVEFIVIVAAVRFGNLGRAGLTADYIAALVERRADVPSCPAA